MRLDSGINHIFIHWENGKESFLGFNKFTRIKPNDAFHIWANGEDQDGERFCCNAEIVSVENRLVLWTIESDLHGSDEFIMTPSEFEPNYRLVIESKSTRDSIQNTLLPIEYTSKYFLDKWE